MKDYGAIRFIFEGDRERAQQYTQIARKLAAMDSIVHQGQQVSDFVRQVDEGVGVHIQQRFGQVQATIFAEPDASGQRGLRREDIIGTLDLVFVLDLTGSFANQVQAAKEAMSELTRQLEAAGIALRTGAVSFADFPIHPWGYPGPSDPEYGSDTPDYPYKLDKALSSDHAATINAIAAMPQMEGNDIPESQLYALKRTAQEAGWSGQGAQIIFLSTDAPFHNPEPGTQQHTPDYPGPSWNDTVATLNSRNIRVYNYGPYYNSVLDIQRIVADTNGSTFDFNTPVEEIVAYLTPIVVSQFVPD